MKILLVQPAGEWVRVEAGRRPLRRAMLRFSVMPLTIVGALTPPRHSVRLIDENVEALDLDAQGRPVIGSACVGCGVCVRACVTSPSSFTLTLSER